MLNSIPNKDKNSLILFSAPQAPCSFGVGACFFVKLCYNFNLNVSMITLDTKLSEIDKVGKTTAKRLEKLGLLTVLDLLYHFPFRYDDFSKILTIADLKTKKSGTVLAKINLIANHRSPRKKMIITEAIVSDKSDSVKVIWFNQPFLTKILAPGKEVYLAGKIDYDDYYGLQFLNPSYEIAKTKAPIHTGRLVPIYPATSNISQKQIRYLIRQVLPLGQDLEDWLPRILKSKYNLIGLSFALQYIHFPENKNWLDKTIHRLKFDELFLIQIRNQTIRKKIKNQIAPKIEFKQNETKKFVDNLPFKLTEAQRKAAWEIIQDLGNNSPMNRLLEGDVGSGKTIVAIITMLNVLLGGFQIAYMVPTEILAEQHFKNISELLKDYPFKIGLLTRENVKINPAKAGEKCKKSEFIKKISSGEIQLVIGTHALIQESVKFKNLALVIIDEQHRFGIEQRALLAQNVPLSSPEFSSKITCPHFLSMTATPIPRSVALTLYGDLDLSILDEMPPGRKKVITQIVRLKEIESTYEFIKEEIKGGRQVFVICPLIDPSDKLGVKSVKEEYEKLSKNVFPEFKMGLLHGKLKAKDKEKIMNDFLKNKINILISTTVVEVGIDIPNASVMIIEGAERFGLAQLYQLKGRIGRSGYQSYCFLFLENEGEKAKKRLKALLTAQNGFELAEMDLEMRGPGEIFGTEQSGFFDDLKIAKLSDVAIIKEAQEAATRIFIEDPNLKIYPLLKKKLEKTIKTTHLE